MGFAIQIPIIYGQILGWLPIMGHIQPLCSNFGIESYAIKKTFQVYKLVVGVGRESLGDQDGREPYVCLYDKAITSEASTQEVGRDRE